MNTGELINANLTLIKIIQELRWEIKEKEIKIKILTSENEDLECAYRELTTDIKCLQEEIARLRKKK